MDVERQKPGYGGDGPGNKGHRRIGQRLHRDPIAHGPASRRFLIYIPDGGHHRVHHPAHADALKRPPDEHQPKGPGKCNQKAAHAEEHGRRHNDAFPAEPVRHRPQKRGGQHGAKGVGGECQADILMGRPLKIEHLRQNGADQTAAGHRKHDHAQKDQEVGIF